MIDIKFLRENPDLVKENIKKKFQNSKLKLVDEVLKLDEKWRKLKFDEDKLRGDRNAISKKIAELKKAKKNADAELKKAKKIPEEIEKIQEKRGKLESEIKGIMYKIPNMIHESVPVGKDDSENKELERIPKGKPKTPNYEIFNHAELAEKLDVVDFDGAREVS
jgi:seryl-tRNA synthetase